MSEDDPRHGTNPGYAAGCRCDPCRDARNTYERARRKRRQVLGIKLAVDATGTRRRIQALMAIGHNSRAIAELCGWTSGEAVLEVARRNWVHGPTAHAISRAYDQLAMTPGASPVTRARAARNGYLPPMAWDDIDDPDERPLSTRERGNYAAAELVAEWDHLRRAGESIERAAQRLGVGVAAIEKAIERVSKKEVA